MIEREKSNNRSIPSIQDFPPCIFYSLYELLFFLSFWLFLQRQLPGQKWLHSISYQHTHTPARIQNVFFDYFYRCFRENHLQGTRMRYYFRFFRFAWVSSTAISNTKRALSYNPNRLVFKPRRQKRWFCARMMRRVFWCELWYATSRTEMRRRIRAHKYFSRARFARLMGDFVVETSRFAEEKRRFWICHRYTVTKRTSFSLSLISIREILLFRWWWCWHMCSLSFVFTR